MGAIVLFTLVLWFIYLENSNVVHVLKEQSVNVLIKTVQEQYGLSFKLLLYLNQN